MKKLSELCINVKDTNDNFVGVKYNKGKIKIIFPIGYSIPKDEEECRKSVINLFKTISLAHEKKLDYEDGGDFSLDSEGLPVDSYMWILSDYIANGLYSDNERVYIQQQKGKINWKRTFKTKFLINKDKSLVYLDPVVEQNSNIKNIITEIHSYSIDKSIDVVGPLYYGLSKISFIKPNPKRIRYYIQLIDKEKLKTFDDRKKLLLYHMKRILLEQIDNGNNPIKGFGVKHYEHIWEYLVNSVFGSSNIEKYYPTTNYVFITKDVYTPSKLRPDTIFIDNNDFYILDSKYYKYGVTGLNKDLPGTDSIQKQVTYGEFINTNFNLDKQYNNIYNAFIIPYNKNDNSFQVNKNIYYCGYAKCNWELSNQYDKKFLKIALILLDTKTLIDSYFEKDNNIKSNLVKEIENVQEQ